MKRKYLLPTILCTVLALTSVGCSKGDTDAVSETSSKSTKKPVSLEIWHYYNGLQQTVFDQKITEFNNTVGTEKGIIVESFSQGNVSDLENKIMSSANKEVGADEMPDIFSSYADTAYTLDEKEMVADLNPYFTEEELSQYRQEYLDEGRFTEDTLKIFPVAKSTELLFLDKTDWDKFSDATGAQVSQLTTMEGVVKTSEDYYNWTDSLTDEPGDGKAFFGRDSLANYMIIGSKQLGKEVFSVDNGKVTYELDPVVFRSLWDNYYVPYIKGYFYSNGRFRSDDMKTGSVVSFVGSTSSASYFPNEVTIDDTTSYPIECMVLPAPIFADGDPYVVQQGAGMVVSKSNADKEAAAAEFLKWFTSTENNLDFSITSGYMPVKTESNTEESISPITSDTSTELNPHIRDAITVSMEQQKNTKFYTNHPFENGSKARNVLETMMNQKSMDDRQAIKDLISSGVSYEEAVSQYNTDENFNQWMKEITETLQTLK